jgi:hypothetical protein
MPALPSEEGRYYLLLMDRNKMGAGEYMIDYIKKHLKENPACLTSAMNFLLKEKRSTAIIGLGHRTNLMDTQNFLSRKSPPRLLPIQHYLPNQNQM